MRDIQELMHKREREINLVSIEKEIHAKAEEEVRKALEGYRGKEARLSALNNELSKENSELKKENYEITKENKELTRQITDLEKKNSEILNEDQELQKENTELIKCNTELKELYEFIEEEKKYFESELIEAEKLIQRLQKTLKLKEDAIMDLHHSRSNLEKELGSLTQQNFHKDSDKKIDFKRLKIPDRRGVSNSPERAGFNFTERTEDVSYKVMCQEAMKIIGVSSSKDFYSKLLHLKQYHSRCKKSRKLIDRLSDMIVQCSPVGSFNKEPNTHQIWKWITRLLEEYMKIKQSEVGEGFIKL